MRRQDKAFEPGEALSIGADLHNERLRVSVRAADVDPWSGKHPWPLPVWSKSFFNTRTQWSLPVALYIEPKTT